jgi:hypothetical protein
MGGPVVTPHSKLRPPVPRAGQVRRRALLGDLAAGMSDLVLVLAPAGFGKTTMISQWAADAGRPLAWATVGETDDDPVRRTHLHADGGADRQRSPGCALPRCPHRRRACLSNARWSPSTAP